MQRSHEELTLNFRVRKDKQARYPLQKLPDLEPRNGIAIGSEDRPVEPSESEAVKLEDQGRLRGVHRLGFVAA